MPDLDAENNRLGSQALRERGRAGRPSPAELGRAVAQLASRQHRLVGAAQLSALGVSPRQRQRWLEAGRLHRIHRGVYAVGCTELGREGRWLAAVMAFGSETLLSHLSAAVLWRMLELDPVVVDVTTTRGRRRRDGIRVHTPTSVPGSDERRVERGVPVTSPVRTFLDLASMVGERRLTSALRAGQREGLFDPLTILNGLAPARGRSGVAAARRVLMRYVPAPGPTRSGLEQEYWQICVAHGSPLPRINTWVGGYEADFLWPELMLIIETDGGPWHSTDVDRAKDADRDATHRDLGYEVIRIPDHQIEDRPQALQIHARILAAAQSPSHPSR